MEPHERPRAVIEANRVAAAGPSSPVGARERLTSPAIENSNRLIGWLQGMDALRRAIGLAA